MRNETKIGIIIGVIIAVAELYISLLKRLKNQLLSLTPLFSMIAPRQKMILLPQQSLKQPNNF